MNETARTYKFPWRSETKSGDEYATFIMAILAMLLSIYVIFVSSGSTIPHSPSTAILDWTRVDDPPPALIDHHWAVDDPLYDGWSYTVTYDDPMWQVRETVDGAVQRILEDDDDEYRSFDTENAARLFVEQLVLVHAIAASENVGTAPPKLWTPNYATIIHTLPDGRSPALSPLARLDPGEPISLTGHSDNGWLEVSYLDSVGWVYQSRGSVDPDLEYPGLDKFLKRIGY